MSVLRPQTDNRAECPICEVRAGVACVRFDPVTGCFELLGYSHLDRLRASESADGPVQLSLMLVAR